MTQWISWGFDATRLGAIECWLTETGGASGPISLTGRYMHHIPTGTYHTTDPQTGERVDGDTEYENFADALAEALNDVGDATYEVTFDPDVPAYTITASGGSVTEIELSAITTPMKRVFGTTSSSLSGALTYTSTHAPWHWTTLDIGLSEWTEIENAMEGEDLIGADGSVRGWTTLGVPRRLDCVAAWEAGEKVWSERAATSDWTWHRAFARVRTVEPIWLYPDPATPIGEEPQAVVAVLRVDGCTLAPRLPSADYVGHQGIPIGAWVLGRVALQPVLLLEDETALLLEDGSALLME